MFITANFWKTVTVITIVTEIIRKNVFLKKSLSMYLFLHLGLSVVVMTWKLKISATGLGKSNETFE